MANMVNAAIGPELPNPPKEKSVAGQLLVNECGATFRNHQAEVLTISLTIHKNSDIESIKNLGPSDNIFAR